MDRHMIGSSQVSPLSLLRTLSLILFLIFGLFTVKVLLGPTEHYFGSGKTIKDAKRSAAQEALSNTKLQQKLPEKTPKKSNGSTSGRASSKQAKLSYVQTPRSELNRIAQERGINVKATTTEEEVIEDGLVEEESLVKAVSRIQDQKKEQNKNQPVATLPVVPVDDRPIAAPDFSKRNNLKITKIYRTSIELNGQTFSCKARTKQASLHLAAAEALNFLHSQSPLPCLPCMYNSLRLLDQYASKAKLRLDLQCVNTNGQPHIPLFKAVYSLYAKDDWKGLNTLMSAEGFGKCKKSAKFEAASNLLHIIEENFNAEAEVAAIPEVPKVPESVETPESHASNVVPEEVPTSHSKPLQESDNKDNKPTLGTSGTHTKSKRNTGKNAWKKL